MKSAIIHALIDCTAVPSNALQGIFITGEITNEDYTFTAAPPAQLGNGDLALAGLADTFAANASSPYYLFSSAK